MMTLTWLCRLLLQAKVQSYCNSEADSWGSSRLNQATRQDTKQETTREVNARSLRLTGARDFPAKIDVLIPTLK